MSGVNGPVSGAIAVVPGKSGASGARPPAGGTGDTWWNTNIPVASFDKPGSPPAYQNFGPNEYFVTPSPLASYTAVGAIAAYQYGDLIKVASTANGNSQGASLLKSAGGAIVAAATPWSCTLKALWNPIWFQTYPEIGIAVSNGTVLGTSTARALAVYQNVTSFGVHQLAYTVGGARIAVNNEQQWIPPIGGTGPLHFRLLNDGAVLHYQLSMGTIAWQDWYSEASIAGFTSVGLLLGNEFGSGQSFGQGLMLENDLETSTIIQQAVTAISANGTPLVFNVADVSKFEAGEWISCHGAGGVTNVNTGTGNFQTTSGLLISSVDAVHSQITVASVTVNGNYTSGGTITNLSRF